MPSENAEVEELRDWKANRGDIRGDPGIAREILEFIEKHRVLSVAMTDAIIGCPYQEGMDYEGEWCPVCESSQDAGGNGTDKKLKRGTY